MNRVHLGVNSRFSPKAILIFRKIARGWGGILESPPWGRNEPTGHSGPLGRPHQVRGRMPCDHGTHRLRVSGSSEHSDDAIQIAPARGRAVHPMTAACCRPGPTGRPAGYCHTLPPAEYYHSVGTQVFQWPKGSVRLRPQRKSTDSRLSPLLPMRINRMMLMYGCHSRSLGSVPAPYSPDFSLPRPCVAAGLERPANRPKP
jgi:hypothetical protein